MKRQNKWLMRIVVEKRTYEAGLDVHSRNFPLAFLVFYVSNKSCFLQFNLEPDLSPSLSRCNSIIPRDYKTRETIHIIRNRKAAAVSRTSFYGIYLHILSWTRCSPAFYTSDTEIWKCPHFVQRNRHDMMYCMMRIISNYITINTAN